MSQQWWMCVLCVKGKGSSGIFDMTYSLLSSIHFLKLVLEITFKGGVGVHVPHFPGGLGKTGESGRVATPHPSLTRFHPMA